jgi:type I restriction enzyme, S subunit
MIEGLKPYSEYADSGERWLGHLPASWKLRRAKFLFREVDERSKSGNEELLSVSHKTGVTPRSQKNITMFMAASNVGHKICRPQDLVINTLWAWMAAMGVSRHTGIVSPAYGVYRPINTETFLPAFADQLLRTPFYADEYQRRSTGVNSSRLRLYPDAFFRIPVVLPPPEEQAAIVRFLDHANRKIDGFIRAKRRLIGLLNEQKQAIIHRAVTRGLNPNAPLKPSGIPWLGDIPKHWEVRRMKNVGKTKIGLTYSPGDVTDSTGHFVLRASNIKNGQMARGDDVFVRKSIPDGLRVRTGDILICARSGSRSLVGKSALIPRDLDGVTFGAFMSLFRSSINDFVFWVLNSNLFKFVMAEFETSTINQLTQGELNKISIPVPPRTEQLEIIGFIQGSADRLTTAIARTEREIALMQEYRTRLTADLVTGKLDVREAAAKLPDQIDQSVPDTVESDAVEETELAEDDS